MKDTLSFPCFTRVWCFSQFTGGISDYNFKSQLALPMANKEDFVIIFGNKNRNFIDYYVEKYDFDETHIIFSKETESTLDKDVYKNMLNTIAKKLKHYKYIHLIPRRVDKDFLKWMYVLHKKIPNSEINYFGDSLNWQSVLGSKEILHPDIKTNKKSIWNHFISNIKTPKGYICTSKKDCINAWKTLGLTSAVIKPTQGCGGKGICYINSLEELKKMKYITGSTVCLEENLFLKHKNLEFYATCYDGDKLIGKPVVQILKKNTFWSGSYTSNSKWNNYLIQLTEQIIKEFKPCGYGGFDFCIADNKTIYVLDVNTGRFTGSHVPILYMQNNDLYGHYVYLSQTHSSSFHNIKKELDSLNINYEILAYSQTILNIIIYDFSFKKVQKDFKKIKNINWHPKTFKPKGCFQKLTSIITKLFTSK